MRVSDVFVGQPIVRPAWGSFDQAIAGLVDHVCACGRLPVALAAEAVRRIREREVIASTAMVDIAVSMPHARLDGVNGIAAAIAVSPTAVYQLADGLPIGIVVLVLSSPALTTEHLNFLAASSLLLQSAPLRRQLRNATSPQDVLQIVRRSERAGG
jgi:mannitol/fructose-specific phosphotransferase system IIA component (Ntr-type)